MRDLNMNMLIILFLKLLAYLIRQRGCAPWFNSGCKLWTDLMADGRGSARIAREFHVDG